MNQSEQHPPVVAREILLPFILVTSLFALWGFANDITNPMVAAFKNILLISNFQSSLVQFAFYGGYCVMAIPAALFIKRFSYKAGILMGLALYSAGCFLFAPAGWLMAFWAFLIAYFVMTCGLSFLETSANPYVLAMGAEENATRRLNFAQAFNPLGSLTGMLVAKNMILRHLNPATEAERRQILASAPEQFQQIAKQDLDVIIGPYLGLGVVVLLVFILFLVSRLPRVAGEDHRRVDFLGSVKRLVRNGRYIEGVVAQAFYVGVQIMCWTFIIQYAENELGLKKEIGQWYNMIAMTIFVSFRFICTYLLKFFSPGGLLLSLATGGGVLILGTMFLKGMAGLYCLVAVSACMSLMFPTIYGIALKGLGDDAKLGAAGLIMAIGGGAIMPPLQGWVMDQGPVNLGLTVLSNTRASFALPLLCFVVIAVYGFRTSKIHGHHYG